MDDPRFDTVIRAIASGSSVDWDKVEADTSDAATHQLLEEFRVIADIAGVHAAARDSAHEPLPIEGRWGPLTLIERIGQGEYAEVYRAREPRLEREVALKLLFPETSGVAADDVIDEGRFIAGVRHPNILIVYGADRIDGRIGIWMELVQGQTLEHILLEQGPFSAREAASIGIEVCRGLAALHHAGLVHRDVKASNIMREGGGRIVLMDLGAGHRLDDMTRRLVGTPLYVAPELLEGAPATVRSDVYAVGVLLYHLVTADYPVRAATIVEIREAHRRKQYSLLADVRPDLPRPVVEVVERAIAHDPVDRFESAGAFEAALTRSLTPQIDESGTARQKRSIIAATVAILVVAAGLGLFTFAKGAASAGARLKFQPKDLVLITRFDNRTGEPVFDGAVEYALQRELSDSNVIGLVPEERVEDSLRLMKRPPGTVIDRKVGREVALRDGHIKAVLAGRIERFGTRYVISASLIDPADDAVVASVGEEASGQHEVLEALGRQATRVRIALGERRDRIKGADPNIEPAATESLRAFQLYNQAYQLGRNLKWSASLELSQQIVAIDPEFASGWIWLAWSARNSGQSRQVPGNDPRVAKVRDYAARALALADRLPEWERYWVTGSYYTLVDDHVRAIPQYEALVKLRPEHYYAYNNLNFARLKLHRPEDVSAIVELRRHMADQRLNDPPANASAAISIMVETGSRRDARPYIDRLRDLAASAEGDNGAEARFYHDFTIAFSLWHSENLEATLEQVAYITKRIELYPGRSQQPAIVGIVSYYLSLGRARDALRFATSLPTQSARQAATLEVAKLTGRWSEVRNHVARYKVEALPSTFWSPATYVSAGLPDLARQAIKGRPLDDPFSVHARGQLLLIEGRTRSAIEHLDRALVLLHTANNPDYWWACNSLADAMWRIGRQTDAITALESCQANRFKTIGPWAPLGDVRMSLDLHLADRYRQVGRIASAEEIEQRVRRRLALADPDFPLVLRLANR